MADPESPQPSEDTPKRTRRGAKSKRKSTAKRAAAKKARPTSQPAAQVRVAAEQLPRRSLEQSLRVAKALREVYAGGPATWEQIAQALEIKPHPQNRYYLWSAQAYNLVQREENNTYSITELGRKILAPTRSNEDREAIVQAVMTPVMFSRFFTDYNGHPFPGEEHIGNVLEVRYGVPRERIDEAKALLRENGLYAGILLQNADGSSSVKLDPASTGIRPLAETPVPSEEPATQVPSPAVGFERICFVITPIGEEDSEQRRHANMILRNVIEPVTRELDLVPVRADQIDRAGLITKQVFEHLARARVCVPDLSFSNPNAFYELGVRHMCKLPTVQFIRKGDKIPFDVSQGRTIKIDMSDVYTVMESVESAKKELLQHIKHALSADYKGEDNPVNTYLPGVEVRFTT
jgi:hypothetical protein